jgi:hypothetical protein
MAVAIGYLTVRQPPVNRIHEGCIAAGAVGAVLRAAHRRRAAGKRRTVSGWTEN